MSLEEFILESKKAREPKKIKITNSYGIKKAFLWARKYKWLVKDNIDEMQYYTVVRQFGLAIAEELSKGISITLPNHMGELYLSKYKPKTEIVDGKVKTNLSVDWAATYKLWHEDPKSKEEKVLIRKVEKYIYKLIYDKTKAEFNNKAFYSFRFMRTLKSKLSLNIINGEVDACLL